jgi:hypothetical protein
LKKGKEIVPVIQERRDQDLSLTEEKDNDSFAFLGVTMKDNGDGSYTLTQEGLIRKILEVTKMADCEAKSTPATTTPLCSDPTGRSFKEEWDYASVVGMFLYLSSNSRLDCQFAVNQCARFMHSPKESHTKAVKRLCRSLKGTSTKGLILAPTKDLALDCSCDADFAGLYLYGNEPDQDPVSVKSRTGYQLSPFCINVRNYVTANHSIHVR